VEVEAVLWTPCDVCGLNCPAFTNTTTLCKESELAALCISTCCAKCWS
jgi:hypothetical protein